MKIQITHGKIDEVGTELESALKNYFRFPENELTDLIQDRFQAHIDHLKEDLHFILEWPYVDKVFRDSYYSYFSSKHQYSVKDCIRISFFNIEVNYDMFRDHSQIENLQAAFVGFIIIRPTSPFIIGRSILSPKALRINHFRCCLATYSVTVNSVKFSIEGFPHSSQDTETITCAETTLWSCLEYFSFKYPEYKPILPSHIINTLSKLSFERQLPSKGLNYNQLSLALREFGFGSKVYYQGQFGQKFPALLSSYIESGIPVILGLNLYDPISKVFMYNQSGHATLCIGREELTDAQIDSCNVATDLSSGAKVYDIDNVVNKNYVIIDDNHPPYQLAKFDEPCKYYNNASWDLFKVAYFIVPLHQKIYLELFEAKKFLFDLLSVSRAKLPDDSKIMVRFYLASSRSFKNWLVTESDMEPQTREIIVNSSMAKFIWVAELGTHESFKLRKANGIVILDATSANTSNMKPLILSSHNDVLINFDQDTHELTEWALPLGEYSIYEDNLKSINHGH